MSEYDKPPELYDGLRLHQNENTRGCSPRVLAALASLRADQVGFYPPYSGVEERCARHLEIRRDQLLLVNGLDEGIMITTASYLRPSPGEPRYEAVIPQPAFEIFELDSEVCGGRVVNLQPRQDFDFGLDEVLAAITPLTRIVFLTNPNNPTGLLLPQGAIEEVSRRLPPGAIVFLDEAYADFAGETFIPRLDAFPNVMVGRTFSKAYGLAGLRIGALVASSKLLDTVRPVLPVYSVNIAAVVALEAALDDQAYVADYLRQVRESKDLLYAACDRWRVQYYRSAANFVLVRLGDRAGMVAQAAAARGIFLRDRSNEPGCMGCIRITTGHVDDTRRAIAVLEELL